MHVLDLAKIVEALARSDIFIITCEDLERLSDIQLAHLHTFLLSVIQGCIFRRHMRKLTGIYRGIFQLIPNNN